MGRCDGRGPESEPTPEAPVQGSASRAPAVAPARGSRFARASRTGSIAQLGPRRRTAIRPSRSTTCVGARLEGAPHQDYRGRLRLHRREEVVSATNNVLYGRMYVWFEDALTTDGHFSLAEGAGTGTPAVVRFGGQFKQFGVGTDAGSWAIGPTKTTSPSLPRPGSAPSSSSRGTPTSSASGGTIKSASHSRPAPKHATFTMPKFDKLWFGWWMYNMKEPQELWIDEIAVDYRPSATPVVRQTQPCKHSSHLPRGTPRRRRAPSVRSHRSPATVPLFHHL